MEKKKEKRKTTCEHQHEHPASQPETPPRPGNMRGPTELSERCPCSTSALHVEQQWQEKHKTNKDMSNNSPGHFLLVSQRSVLGTSRRHRHHPSDVMTERCVCVSVLVREGNPKTPPLSPVKTSPLF